MSSLLTISTASVIVDAITIALTFTKADIFYSSPDLYEWYEKYRFAAAILDILILVIGFGIIDYVANKLKIKQFSAMYYILGVALQVIHDMLFYGLITIIPKGYDIFDFFKKYAKNDGVWAIIGDSLMIITTGLLYSLLKSRKLSTRAEVFLLLVSIYILTYILYLR